MLPPFYHNSEKNVRICDDCNMLMLVFVDALKSGDQATALAVFNTGNVNLHRPFSLFASGAYAVSFLSTFLVCSISTVPIESLISNKSRYTLRRRGEI